MSRRRSERLIEAAEDAADIRACAEFKRRLAAGEEELIPAEVVKRIVNGENKIRVWREYRGMNVADLAAQAGVSQDDLSRIEAGERDGGDVIERIAAALNLDMYDLL
jgi:DNA-binding XRE family transcriptional regulator